MLKFSDASFFAAAAYALMGLTLLWHMLRRTLGSYAVLSAANVGACTYFAAVGSDDGLYLSLAAFVVGIFVVIPLTNTVGWRSRR